MNSEANPGYFTCLIEDYRNVIKGRKKIDFCYTRNYIVIAFLMKLIRRRNSQPYDSSLSWLALLVEIV
jgi:hypothetical protein